MNKHPTTVSNNTVLIVFVNEGGYPAREEKSGRLQVQVVVSIAAAKRNGISNPFSIYFNKVRKSLILL